MDPFAGIGKAEMARRIADARLDSRDALIAQMRLIDRMHFADIGAEVGCDRRTAARRYRSAVDVLNGIK